MKRRPTGAIIAFFLLMAPFVMLTAKNRILADDVKSLQSFVGNRWTEMAVMNHNSSEKLHVGFDLLTHEYHRIVCHIDHCDPDWNVTEGLFDSDFLEGFNDVIIDNYETSVNTTVPYTHYTFSFPAEGQRLKLSGNYLLSLYDEDRDMTIAEVQIRVVEQKMNLGLSVTTNTDIDHNISHQQIEMSLGYGQAKVTNPREQLCIKVMQNFRETDTRNNPKATYTTQTGLRWEHCRDLIFNGGNEFHKFEILDVSHTTLGLSSISWSEDEQCYHAYPYPVTPIRNYLLDKDADGAFYIRNSDNVENDITSDYVIVHYKLANTSEHHGKDVIVDGQWTTEAPEKYLMNYNAEDKSYNAAILQKQGYYNYQIVVVDPETGKSETAPEEGAFYQTENQYQALVYFRENGGRAWQLVAYRNIFSQKPL